ncbi:MAG: signal peptidase I [Clostridiales bacterium]|nr:signal peptidase I [Clostridiales bacterium]
MKTETKQDKKNKAALRRAVTRRNDGLPGGGRFRALDFIIMLLAVFVFALAVRVAVLEPVRVKGTSMLSTLHEGDFMVVEKLTYAFSKPRRGDILILYYPDNLEYTCVKRVIGLAGEEVQIEDGRVFINGVLLSEPYLDQPIDGRYDGTTTVEDGCVFVLGDNRRVSKDSSTPGIGAVRIERIVGKVAVVLYPLSHIRTFPRPIY